MGTNYYVKAEQPEPCPTCGHQETAEPLHIGKSSAGWKFLFAPHPDIGLSTWRAWRDYLANKEIVDEYGQSLALDELSERVENKQREGLTAFTATRMQWGPSDPAEYETVDADGYRFSKTADFC